MSPLSSLELSRLKLYVWKNTIGSECEPALAGLHGKLMKNVFDSLDSRVEKGMNEKDMLKRGKKSRSITPSNAEDFLKSLRPRSRPCHRDAFSQGRPGENVCFVRLSAARTVESDRQHMRWIVSRCKKLLPSHHLVLELQMRDQRRPVLAVTDLCTIASNF